MSIGTKAAKYAAVGNVTVRNHLAYIMDFLLRTGFYCVIIYIFTQLWRTTFGGEGTDLIAGYSFEQMIWYLIFAEAIVMSCPSLSLTIENEVKSGDIGYKLTRPISYLLYQYMAFSGEAALRFVLHLVVGSLLGLLLFGPPSFGYGWIGFVTLAVGGFTIQYLLTMSLALCAFWVEETRGLEFVYSKLLFTIGGMLLPLEMFPEALQKVCAWLPFQAIVYFPARTAVRFDGDLIWQMLGIQLLWVVALSGLLTFVFRKGVRKLHVNGG